MRKNSLLCFGFCILIFEFDLQFDAGNRQLVAKVLRLESFPTEFLNSGSNSGLNLKNQFANRFQSAFLVGPVSTEAKATQSTWIRIKRLGSAGSSRSISSKFPADLQRISSGSLSRSPAGLHLVFSGSPSRSLQQTYWPENS